MKKVLYILILTAIVFTLTIKISDKIKIHEIDPALMQCPPGQDYDETNRTCIK